MLKISTITDDIGPKLCTRMVECPVCGRRLFDAQYVSGVAILFIRCKCKHLIKVKITE